MTIETRTIQPFPSRRTAVVTGAGAPRGIGRRVVRKLLAEGWSVAAADIDGTAVEEFAAEVAKMATADVETGHVELVGGADDFLARTKG
mgnify:CR=1 FL=1